MASLSRKKKNSENSIILMASVWAKPTLSSLSLSPSSPQISTVDHLPHLQIPTVHLVLPLPPSPPLSLPRPFPQTPLPSPPIPSLSPHPHLSILAVGSDTRPTVLISEKLGEAGLDLLRAFSNVNCSYNLSQQELCSKISECDALIVRNGTKVTREVFEAFRERLKVVGRASIGIDNVDLHAATEHGCLVVNAPTANIVAAAENGISPIPCASKQFNFTDPTIFHVIKQPRDFSSGK